MERQSVIHYTFVIERNYPVPTERVSAPSRIQPRNAPGLSTVAATRSSTMRWIFE